MNPLIFHWNTGELPPFTGVAVKVTGVPWQTGFADGEMLTLTGRLWLMVIVIALDVAGLPVAHDAFEVRRQVTMSPSDGIYV